VSQLRVLIADDEELVREAVSALIGSDDGLTLVGSARDAAEAIELAALHQPAVALIDVKMQAEVRRLPPASGASPLQRGSWP